MYRFDQHCLLVPFGTDRWSMKDILVSSLGPRSMTLATPFPCAAIDLRSGDALRLNNGAFAIHPAGKPASEGSPFEVVRDAVCGHVDAWGGPAQRFLRDYFDAVSATIGRDRALIEASMPTCAGLYSAEDWLYSAPLPLPRAHLNAPASSRPHGTEEDYVRVDVVFWNGERFVAIDAGSSSLLPRRAAERAERLRRAGIDVVSWAGAAPAGFDAFFPRLLPRRARYFWQTRSLPTGPFRSDALDLLDAFAAQSCPVDGGTTRREEQRSP
jgi:hypothetical protein